MRVGTYETERKNSGENISWTDYEDGKLAETRMRGMTYEEISALFEADKRCSSRTPKSIKCRWLRIRNDSPIVMEIKRNFMEDSIDIKGTASFWKESEDSILIEMKQNGFSNEEISLAISSNENCSERSVDAVRNRWSKINGTDAVDLMTENRKQVKTYDVVVTKGDSSDTVKISNLRDFILTATRKKPVSYSDLSKLSGWEESLVRKECSKLCSEGFPLNMTDTMVACAASFRDFRNSGEISESPLIIDSFGKSETKKNRNAFGSEEAVSETVFGVVSDTHFGSKKADVDSLHKFYDIAYASGVRTFLHAGDWMDGMRVYKGQEMQQNKIGFDEQVKAVIEDYPRMNGVITYGIVGNHDDSFMSVGGADALGAVCAYRPDIRNIGFYQGYVELDGFKIRLHHPDGGGAYAISYKIQKFLEAMRDELDLYVVGHYHTSLAIPGYNGVKLSLMAGSFQRATDFAYRKGLREIIGGWIVTMKKTVYANGKKITEVVPKWVDLL